jgi:ferric-dicitrate binding protein FerR (iron transport regulator)
MPTKEAQRMPFRRTGRRTFLAPALCLALAAAITACSSSSSSSSSAPATTATASGTPAASSSSGGSAATVATIKTNWEEFFSSSTPNSKRVELLQNGQVFASAVNAFAASPLASAVSAKVTSVTVTSPTQATVKYNLTAAGVSVFSGTSGVAVLDGGVWKVGDASFCGLLKTGASLLKIPLPSACK